MVFHEGDNYVFNAGSNIVYMDEASFSGGFEMTRGLTVDSGFESGLAALQS